MSDDLTPEQRDGLAKARYTVLTALRASGVVLMLIGLALWHSNLVKAGGFPEAGVPIFVFGMVESLVLPAFLGRRWRSDRRR